MGGAAVSDRPTLQCLVGFVSPAFGIVGTPRIMSLEAAVDYAQFGFAVLVDPENEADLARWEQIQRSMHHATRRSDELDPEKDT